MPLEVRYDEHTVNVVENQLLLAAVTKLLRAPTLRERHRAGLQRMRLLLADVTLPPKGHPLRWVPSRLNGRYQPALWLADLILSGRSSEQRVGEITVTGYLLNMAKIFEDFVCVALREQLAAAAGRAALQHKTSLVEDGWVPIQPDFVWFEGGAPRIVADAKYKAEKPSGFPQADLYQLLAYCTALGLEDGHLVYAKGNEDERAYEIRNVGIRVHAHALRIDAEPESVLAAVKTVAAKMSELAVSAAGRS